MHASIINSQLMEVKQGLLDGVIWAAYAQPMVNDTAGFAKRFSELRGGMSLQALSEAIERKTGKRVTAQAMHKWEQGGGITDDSLKLVADFYGVTLAWLRYGIGPTSPFHLEDALRPLSADSRQQVFDFIQYKIEKAEGMITSDTAAVYHRMIEKIRHDMDDKKNGLAQ